MNAIAIAISIDWIYHQISRCRAWWERQGFVGADTLNRFVRILTKVRERRG